MKNLLKEYKKIANHYWKYSVFKTMKPKSIRDFDAVKFDTQSFILSKCNLGKMVSSYSKTLGGYPKKGLKGS